jgi:MFS family permease
MVPDLVPAEDLLGAVSLSSAQYNLGRVIGPALAGLVLLTDNCAFVFGINALSFGAVVVALLLVHLPKPLPVTGSVRMLRRIVQGAQAARAEPGCRSAIGWIAVVALLASPFIALVPAMAKQYVHTVGIGLPLITALLVTAQGIGAVAGALALPGLAIRYGRQTMLRTALFTVPLLLCAYALAPSLPLALVAFVAVGAGYIFVLSGLNTVVQLRAPAAARGRILSIYMMALGLLYPVGALVQGLLADSHGIRAVTVAGAVALLAVCVLTAILRPTAFTNLADPEPAGDAGAPGRASSADTAATGGSA